MLSSPVLHAMYFYFDKYYHIAIKSIGHWLNPPGSIVTFNCHPMSMRTTIESHHLSI